jgi:Outer membrane protein beta-barrel domain
MGTQRTQACVTALLLVVLAAGTRGAFAQTSADAQASSSVELFGGYSYQRLNSAGGNGTGLNGWAADMQANVKRSFALATSFSGAYGEELGANLQLYTFLAGPRLVCRSKRDSFFVHALIGGARLNASAARVGDNRTSFAAALGGGVDVKLTRHTAVRVFQADYLLTRLAGRTQNDFRVSTGIVIRLGGPR